MPPSILHPGHLSPHPSPSSETPTGSAKVTALSPSPTPPSPIKGYRMWESLVSTGCRNLWEDEFVIRLFPTAPRTCPQA